MLLTNNEAFRWRHQFCGVTGELVEIQDVLPTNSVKKEQNGGGVHALFTGAPQNPTLENTGKWSEKILSRATRHEKGTILFSVRT